MSNDAQIVHFFKRLFLVYLFRTTRESDKCQQVVRIPAARTAQSVKEPVNQVPRGVTQQSKQGTVPFWCCSPHRSRTSWQRSGLVSATIKTTRYCLCIELNNKNTCAVRQIGPEVGSFGTVAPPAPPALQPQQHT